MRGTSLFRRLLCSAAVVFALAAAILPAVSAAAQGRIPNGIPDRITAAVSSSRMAAIPGSVSPRALQATDLGPLPADTVLSGMSLRFTPSAAQQAAIDQLLARPAGPRIAALPPVAHAAAVRRPVRPQQRRPGQNHRLARRPGVHRRRGRQWRYVCHLQRLRGPGPDRLCHQHSPPLAERRDPLRQRHRGQRSQRVCRRGWRRHRAARLPPEAARPHRHRAVRSSPPRSRAIITSPPETSTPSTTWAR